MVRVDILKEWPHKHKKLAFRPVWRAVADLRPVAYGALNIISASGIVFANKAVFAHYHFHFTITLTFIHTLFTIVGMVLFARFRLFEVKQLKQRDLLPLSFGFVSYIVLCNLSLKINTVGFYQVMKIAVAPTVLVLEAAFFKKIPTVPVVASVGVVCVGIGLATVTDSQIISNLVGLGVGFAATLMTALYQIWAGTKQKELKASSMQLLHAYTPQAAVLLLMMVLTFEPLGLTTRNKDTILGYSYTVSAVSAILISAALGLLVSLSTFLVIGATSSLTYNVVGHLKTVIILTGGCIFFGDSMPAKKLAGVLVAMCGIIWYTHLKLYAGEGSKRTAASAGADAPGTPRNGLGLRPDEHTPLLPVAGARGAATRRTAA